MNTNNTDALRQQLTARFAEYLTERLGRGGTQSLNIGDCFVQVTVLDLVDEGDDGGGPDDEDDADVLDPLAAELLASDSADSAEQGFEALDLLPTDYEEFEAYGASGTPAQRRALLIDMNGLGCLVGPSTAWTPEADRWLNAPSQTRMLDAGMRPPQDGLPLWWTRMDTSLEADTVAATLVTALVDALEIPAQVVVADLDARAPRRRGPRRLAATTPLTDFTPTTDDRDIVAEPEALLWDYGAHLLLRREQQVANWPWAAEDEAVFFALVDRLDLESVQELVALAPAGPGSSQAAWFRRFRTGWFADPTLPRRMARTGSSEPLRSISRDVAMVVDRRLRF